MPRPSLLARRTVLASLAAFAAAPGFAFNAQQHLDPDWTTPLPPFRIAGNLFYVGSRDLASFLVTTQQGHILINSNLASSPPQIRASVEQLGFEWRQIEILLISHAHYDHCAGSARILRETGAKYMVMDGDAADIPSGGKANFHYGSHTEMLYPAAKVDRVLHDGDRVRLGETTLTAHKTAGHTQGCTTWTMPVADRGKTCHAVIVGGPNVLTGYNLIDDPKYPRMAADFQQQFKTLTSLPCDLFLGAHGGFFDLLEKYARLKAGPPVNPFLDRAGYLAYIADRQQAFASELAKQAAMPPRM